MTKLFHSAMFGLTSHVPFPLLKYCSFSCLRIFKYIHEIHTYKGILFYNTSIYDLLRSNYKDYIYYSETFGVKEEIKRLIQTTELLENWTDKNIQNFLSIFMSPITGNNKCFNTFWDLSYKLCHIPIPFHRENGNEREK